MQTHPYLIFEGRCEEAIHFYSKALGAEVVMMMRMKDSPEPPPPGSPPGSENKVLHASLRIGNTTISASDGMNRGKPTFQGFSIALSTATEAETDRVFKALSDGGSVQMPLTKTFFSPRFGMTTDRFGVAWMVMLEQKQ